MLGCAFEGCGVQAIAHVGVLKVLEEKKIQLTHVCGSSAGAMIATMVACRLSYDVIKQIVLETDYTTFINNDPWNLFRLITYYGWNTGDAIVQSSKHILLKYIGNADITLNQIKNNYDMTLIITATSVAQSSTMYYSPYTTPDMRVIDAIRESSSIPILYQPVVKKNDMMVDGGVLDNYLIEKLYDYLPTSKVFGVRLMSKTTALPTNIVQYISKIIKMMHDQADDIYITNNDLKNTIIIDVGTIAATDFNIKPDQKLWLMDQGEAAALKFFTLY